MPIRNLVGKATIGAVHTLTSFLIDYADIFLSNQSLLDVILGIYRGKPPSTYNVLDSDDLPDIYAGFLSSPLDHILSKRKQSGHNREAVLLTSTPETNLECQLHIFAFTSPSDCV